MLLFLKISSTLIRPLRKVNKPSPSQTFPIRQMMMSMMTRLRLDKHYMKREQYFFFTLTFFLYNIDFKFFIRSFKIYLLCSLFCLSSSYSSLYYVGHTLRHWSISFLSLCRGLLPQIHMLSNLDNYQIDQFSYPAPKKLNLVPSL